MCSRHCSMPQRSANVGKHEIQTALHRRRAAMTRAVLPKPARAEWLLAGIIDRALSHWVRAPPLVGRDDDGNADTGPDTTAPDDDSHPDHKPLTVVCAPPWASSSPMNQHALEALRGPRRVFLHHHRLSRSPARGLQTARFGSTTTCSFTVH